MKPAREKWQSAAVAEHYARERFAGERARSRDMRLIESLWRRCGPSGKVSSLLDVPCGTGRLRASLSKLCERYQGADISPAMLVEAGNGGVLADASRLPFADRSFDIVVCCRLLHHLDEREELEAVTRELVRVTDRLLLASFWCASSWPALRRRLGWRRDETGRRAVSAQRLEACFESAGAEVLGYASSLPWLSMQTFVAARPRSSARSS